MESKFPGKPRVRPIILDLNFNDGHQNQLIILLNLFLAMELPVIATAVGGTPEVIEDMKNGCLIHFSSDEILRKLNLLVENRQLRIRLGTSARKTAIARFSMEIIAKRYIELYNSLR